MNQFSAIIVCSHCQSVQGVDVAYEIKNTKMNGYLHENIWLAKYLSELYLPKQKVKDKIKELEKAKNKTNKEHWKYNYTLQIAILKELLEESK